MEASRWLRLQGLIDAEEMASLFEALSPFRIYSTASAVKKGQGEIAQEHFLSIWFSYIQSLKRGEIPEPSRYLLPFSSLFTRSEEALYSIELDAERELLRLAAPAIQLQPLYISYSKEAGKFQAMAYGKEAISWGVQFSFPQLFLDKESGRVIQTLRERELLNGALFKELRKWFRMHTRPALFEIGGSRLASPFRIGKKSVEWIEKHPQLKELAR